MILYSPSGMNLKEVASLAEVSPGLIRLWRTEPAFKETAKKAFKLFAQVMANSIDFCVFKFSDKGGDKRIRELLAKEIDGFTCIDIQKDSKYPLDGIGPFADMIYFYNESVIQILEKWLEKRLNKDSFVHSLLAFRWASGQPKNEKDLRKWEMRRLPFTKLIIEMKLKLLSANDGSIDEEVLKVDLKDFIFRVFDNLAS